MLHANKIFRMGGRFITGNLQYTMVLIKLNCAVCFVFLIYSVHSCGFDKCAKIIDNGINVHMVSHSHDDVGWVKTVAQYYHESVRSILDTVVDALLANPERKFIQVETAFLYIWWTKQTKQRKDQVRQLVNNGQLEIAGGAWSMNDEAATHYHSIIDSFTLGLRFLNDTLGPCAAPKVGWQVDPFGHSRQMAQLFSEFGFKALFFGRLDHNDKRNRILTKNMELIWRSNKGFGNETDLFTSVLYNLYQPPDGFCFDNLCGYSIGAYNEEKKVNEFIFHIEEMSKAYRTNNIMMTMGGDFTYTIADIYFKNIDYLIKSIRKRNSRTSDGRRINIFYSTPACYYHAVKSSHPELRIKVDDFFPYADKRNSYWTGFFTSRPTSKRFEREGNNLLQVSKQLAVLARTGTNNDLFDLSSAMGIMQHHDAITGTEKQFVANDYAYLIHNAMEQSIRENGKRIESLYNINWNNDFRTCNLANMTICSLGSAQRFAIILYNPLGYSISQHVRLPVAFKHYTIRKSITEKVPYQISEPLRRFRGSIHGDSLPYELTFLAENIPPLGIKQYVVTVDEHEEPLPVFKVQPSDYILLGTSELGLRIDFDCNLKSISNSNISIQFEQNLMYYTSKQMLHVEGRPSGAYIFSPKGNAKHFAKKNCSVRVGTLFDEIRVEYEDWAGQIIRVYKDQKKYIEFDWIVGRIQLDEKHGKEIISRFNTNLNSGLRFRTDTNGRSHIIRHRNYRATYPFFLDDEISSNYYPLTTYIGIEDVNKQQYLTIFTDRAQGGSSLRSGELEIMLHRRLVDDDNLGVEEVLNEKHTFMGAVARGQHIIDFGFSNQRSDEGISRENNLKPWLFLVPLVINDSNIWNIIDKEYHGITRELPPDVHLLTLEPWKRWQNKILIRLEHINEDGFPVVVHLKHLFLAFEIVELVETNLSANQWKPSPRLRHNHSQIYKSMDVFLRPMEIRTFVATIEYYL